MFINILLSFLTVLGPRLLETKDVQSALLFQESHNLSLRFLCFGVLVSHVVVLDIPFDGLVLFMQRVSNCVTVVTVPTLRK